MRDLPILCVTLAILHAILNLAFKYCMLFIVSYKCTKVKFILSILYPRTKVFLFPCLFFSISDYQQLIRKGPYNHQFTVQHFHGTNPVVYSVTGWLRYSREHASARQISNLLQESQK